MCKLCIERLVLCYEFRTMCRESDKKLYSAIISSEEHNYSNNDDVIFDVDSDVTIENLDCSEVTETEKSFVENSTTAQQHQETATEETRTVTSETHICLFCKRTFYSKHAYNRHLKIHEDGKDLICPVSFFTYFI